MQLDFRLSIQVDFRLLMRLVCRPLMQANEGANSAQAFESAQIFCASSNGAIWVIRLSEGSPCCTVRTVTNQNVFVRNLRATTAIQIDCFHSSQFDHLVSDLIHGRTPRRGSS